MDINVSYFGTQDSGIVDYTNTFYGHTVTFKVPNWAASGSYIVAGSYLAKAVQDSSAITTDFDVSLAHCGIGAKGNTLDWTYTDAQGNQVTDTLTAHYDHYMRSIHWLSLNRDVSVIVPGTGDTDVIHFGIDDDDGYNANYAATDIPVWLTSYGYNNNARTFSATQYTDSNVPSYYNWGTGDDQKYYTPQSLGYNKPMIQYGLGDMVWVIRVECSSTAEGSNSRTVALADYIDTTTTYNYTNRPYIGRVYAIPYTWSSGGASQRTLSPTLMFMAPSFGRKFSVTAPYYTRLKPGATGTKNFYYYDMMQSYGGAGTTYQYSMYNIFCTSNTINGTDWTTETQSYPSGVYDSQTPTQSIHYYYVAGYNFWSSCGFGELRPVGSSSGWTMQTCILHPTTQADLDALVEYAHEMCAYLGMFFADKAITVTIDTTLTEEEQWTQAFEDDRIYCGIIDDNGLTHGFYTHGAGNKNTRAYANTNAQIDNPYKPTPFDPTPPKPDADPNRYIDTMQGKNAASFTAFTKLYAVDGFNMLNLRLYLAHIPTEGNTLDEHQDYLYKHFLNSNPIDNIVSLKVYPFSILQYVFGNVYTTETIRISNALAEYALSDTATIRAIGNRGDGAFSQITLFLGSFTLYTAYGDFRDYDPYSSAKLYLPYCGTATIDIKTILDKTLYVAYKVDIKTGSCTAVVTQDSYDGIIVLTAHGTMAVDIPITGIQTADYQNAIFQGITNLKNAQMQQFTSYIHAATGLTSSVGAVATSPMAIPGAVTGIADSIAGISTSNNALKQAEYNLQTAPIKHTMVGSSSAGDAQLMYMYPALIVTRPKFLSSYNQPVYAHTVGHACILSDTLGNFHGYTVVSDIDLSGVPATDAEQQMLRAILAAGVYL